jgi:hypothetical protein
MKPLKLEREEEEGGRRGKHEAAATAERAGPAEQAGPLDWLGHLLPHT